MRYLLIEIQDYSEIASMWLSSPAPEMAAPWLMKRARAIAQLRNEAKADAAAQELQPC